MNELTMSGLPMPLLASRMFNTPLMIAEEKMTVILGRIGHRLGIVPPSVEASPFVDTMSDPAKRAMMAAPIVENGLAIIDVEGILVHQTNGCAPLSGTRSYQWIGGQVAMAADDPEVKGIVLRIHSPGGEVHSCFETAAYIDRIDREVKPVFSVISSMAMSAAYALASSGREIIAAPAADIGSIGVVTTHYDMTAAAAKDGVKVTYLHAGARKMDTAPFRSLDDPARAAIMQRIDDTYDLFVSHVAAARGMTPQAVMDTEAGIFIGQRAVSLGLADMVMSEADAIAWCAGQVSGAGPSAAPRAITATTNSTKRSKPNMSKAILSKSRAEATENDDDMNAEDGADTIEGGMEGDGADTMQGAGEGAGDGADSVEGGEGADTVEAGAGGDAKANAQAAGRIAGKLSNGAADAERARCATIVGLLEPGDDPAMALAQIRAGADIGTAALAMRDERVQRIGVDPGSRRAAMPKPVPNAAPPAPAATTGLPKNEAEAKARFETSEALQKEYGSFEAYWSDQQYLARKAKR